ncbi:hypothetical protein KCU88_g371, partial [Aureobasidium melanogenum]
LFCFLLVPVLAAGAGAEYVVVEDIPGRQWPRTCTLSLSSCSPCASPPTPGDTGRYLFRRSCFNDSTLKIFGIHGLLLFKATNSLIKLGQLRLFQKLNPFHKTGSKCLFFLKFDSKTACHFLKLCTSLLKTRFLLFKFGNVTLGDNIMLLFQLLQSLSGNATFFHGPFCFLSRFRGLVHGTFDHFFKIHSLAFQLAGQ